MILKRLRLHNFKNYQDQLFEFGHQVNLLTGDNGMGKTNVLDALYFLALTRSHSLQTDLQIRRDQKHDYIVEALIEKEEASQLYQIKLENGQKKVYCNREPYKRMQEHIGKLPIIYVFPGEIGLIYDDASVRRRYMDQSISQYDNAYMQALSTYKKALSQRNACLKNENIGVAEKARLLDVYDEQMIACIPKIMEDRLSFCSSINEKINEEYQSIAIDKFESASLQLRTKVQVDSYSNQLQSERNRDMILGRTQIGPHRDDLTFLLNERPIKKYGSQGQMKSYLVALKLTNFHLFEDHLGVKPFLLLDDIFDKLDEKRIENLINTVLTKNFGQVFITTTSSYVLKNIFSKKGIQYKHYQIRHGQIVNHEEEEE